MRHVTNSAIDCFFLLLDLLFNGIQSTTSSLITFTSDPSNDVNGILVDIEVEVSPSPKHSGLTDPLINDGVIPLHIIQVNCALTARLLIRFLVLVPLTSAGI